MIQRHEMAEKSYIIQITYYPIEKKATTTTKHKGHKIKSANALPLRTLCNLSTFLRVFPRKEGEKSHTNNDYNNVGNGLFKRPTRINIENQ